MSKATHAFQLVFRASDGAALVASDGASADGAATDAGGWEAGACVAGADVAPVLEQAEIMMADAAPSATSRRETCNVHSSCDPGHPSAAGRAEP